MPSENRRRNCGKGNNLRYGVGRNLNEWQHLSGPFNVEMGIVIQSPVDLRVVDEVIQGDRNTFLFIYSTIQPVQFIVETYTNRFASFRQQQHCCVSVSEFVKFLSCHD